MREAKSTQRSLVKIGYDGRVHKTFRGPKARERFENEVRVLQYLETRECPFVPRLLAHDSEALKIVTSNCGAIAQNLPESRATEVFAELEAYGVRHEDPFARNITYRASDGRFCAIDFEFAEILDDDPSWHVSSEEEANSDVFRLRWSGMTDRGKLRPNNEDVFLALTMDGSGIRYLGKTGSKDTQDCDFLFAVSDGMGGARSGEFASRIALERIIQLLPKEFNLNESRFRSYATEILSHLFASIHDSMIELGKYDPHCQDMGATLTLIWLRRGLVHYAHIGDSRLYQLREGKLAQLSHDHSYVGWLRREGKLSEREAREHPRKNALDQALGAKHQFLRPQVGFTEMKVGDRLLLCSDGVTEALWDERITSTISSAESEHEAFDLVRLAVSESGKDNATAVVVAVEAAGADQ